MKSDGLTADAVAKLLVAGNSVADIKDFITSNDLGASEADELIDAGLFEIEKCLAIPAPARRAWCVEALREVYRRLIETGDYNGAIKAVVEISKITGANKVGANIPQKPAGTDSAKGSGKAPAGLRVLSSKKLRLKK